MQGNYHVGSIFYVKNIISQKILLLIGQIHKIFPTFLGLFIFEFKDVWSVRFGTSKVVKDIVDLKI